MTNEFDVAASNPCPFCPNLRTCPIDHAPDDICLDLWPLGRPAHRDLEPDNEEQRRHYRIALANPAVAEMADRWCAGEQLTDEDYLCLRSLMQHAATEPASLSYLNIMCAFLRLQSYMRLCNAVAYYGICGDRLPVFDVLSAAFLWGGVVVANEHMAKNDPSVPVPSHFERIVAEVEKTGLFVVAGMPFLQLPREDRAFKRAVEEDWRRVLTYGNGFHGFNVFPRIFIDDLVRYQQLGGGGDLVSWSIGNWIIWSMTAFPHPAQTVAPKFGEKVFGRRLVQMYEPLVQSFATKLVRRAGMTEGRGDAPDRADVVEALRALLGRLIEEYDFMRGKPKDGQMIWSVGAIGPESSPKWRTQLDGRLQEFGLPMRARDLVHVGFARYAVGKFHTFLREMYPVYEDRSLDPSRISRNLVEGTGEAVPMFTEDSKRRKEQSDAGPGVPVAFKREGVEWFYVRQMVDAARDMCPGNAGAKCPNGGIGHADPHIRSTTPAQQDRQRVSGVCQVVQRLGRNNHCRLSSRHRRVRGLGGGTPPNTHLSKFSL